MQKAYYPVEEYKEKGILLKPPTCSFSKNVYRLDSETAFDYLKIADEVEKTGMDVISFGVGQPDFDTPKPIKEAAIKALNAGHTGYVAVPGIPELRTAIAKHVTEFTKSDVKDYEVIVTPGAKTAIYTTIMHFIEPGDEVIIPDPNYPTYQSVVKYAGGHPVHLLLKEEKEFRTTPEDIDTLVTNKTKMIILTSPQNPTGGMNTRNDVEGILEIAKRKRLIILSDEIYDHYVYDGEHTSPLTDSSWRDNVIYVNGFSKTYSMTGWRLGYLAAEPQIVSAISNIQDHSTSNPNSIN